MLRALVHDTSIGGLMIRQGRASNQWLYLHWSPLLVAYCTWRGLRCAVWHSFIPGSWSAWIAPVQALLLLLDDVLVGATRLARKASQFTLLVRLLCLTLIHSPWKEARTFNYNPGPSRISGVLTDGIDMSTGNAWLPWFPWYWPWFPGTFLLGWLSLCTSWQCWATWSEWTEVWYTTSCWRSCESRGIELCAR